MSAREKLEQIKRERELRLAQQAAGPSASSLSAGQTVSTQRNGRDSKPSTVNKTASNGGPLLTWQAQPPTPLLAMATPAPPLSVKDLSLSGSRHSEKAEGESVLASYWDRHDISAMDHCNSYTSISYEERGGTDDSPGFLGGIPTRHDADSAPPPSLSGWQEPTTDVVAAFRKRSEAALRASLDLSVELNLRRLNAPLVSPQPSLDGSLGHFNGQRNIGFDTDGLLEPYDDSTCVSVSQYSTANNVNVKNGSERRKYLQKSSDAGAKAENKDVQSGPAPFCRHARNSVPKQENNIKTHSNDDQNRTGLETNVKREVYQSVEERLRRLESTLGNIADQRINDFIRQYGGS